MGQYDFSQNDPAWLNTPLGFSNYYYLGTHNGSHAVAAGCYVTSLAMAASYLGHPINPNDMNALLKQNNLIDAQGDIVYNDTLNRLWPDIQYVERVDWPTELAPLNYFDIRNDVNTEIIVLIDDSPASGLQQHWLRVVGWDGNSDIIVVDPWDGVRKGLSAYANRSGTSVPKIIYGAVKYHKLDASDTSTISNQPVQQPVPQPAPDSSTDPVVSTAPLPAETPPPPAGGSGLGTSGDSSGTPAVPVPAPSTPVVVGSTAQPFNALAWLWSFVLRLLKPRSKKKL